MSFKKYSLKVATTFRVFIFLLILHAAGLFAGCSVYSAFNTVFNEEWTQNQITAPKTGTPRIEYLNSIPVIHLYGNPYEMGNQYGKILNKQLEALEFISQKFFSKATFEKYLEQAENLQPNLPYETLEFISGMAVSSGVDYHRLLALNTVPKTTCSVLAVWGDATSDGRLLMGRNADYNFKKINKGLGLIVVKHPDTGNATVSSSFLGLAGTFTGMNEKGVCYGNMLVYNGFEEENYTGGLPVQLLMQQAAENSNTAREMTDYLTARKHIIPVNVMCADSTEAIVLELGQEKFAIREGEKKVLAATNYFYSSGMFESPKNDLRLSLLLNVARKNYGQFNLENLKTAMHHARRRNQNLQCVLFEPSLKTMHVSMNNVPASKGPFFAYNLEKLFEK